MNIYERYNIQRSQYRDDDDPIAQHITNLSRLLGKALTSGLDSYIITMIETNDGRRALMDIKEIDNVMKTIEKDAAETAKKSFVDAFSNINATITIR